jgi:hypothetical protein
MGHPAPVLSLTEIAMEGTLLGTLRRRRQAIRCGSFTFVRELIAAIGTFIDSWNEHAIPFTWTKDADQIRASIKRAKTKANVLTKH